MKVFYSDHYEVPLPAGHRFPMAKYRLLREALQAAGWIAPQNLHASPPAEDEDLARVHTADYLARLYAGELTRQELRRLGFPWSPELVIRARRSAGGTLAACRAALEDGIGVNLAGGTHHAFPDHGEGFCVLNDCAIAVRAMQAAGLVERVVIVDCDVHQGNGTAFTFQGDATVFTFSIHGARNFPFRKQPSDLDINLEDYTTDGPYLDALADGLEQSLAHQAQLAIYLAGADPYAGDRLGRLKLTKAGLAGRDRIVLDACQAAGVPVAITMAGGYAEPVQDTVAIHVQTVRIAAGRCGIAPPFAL